jgi:DNA-binding Lrp family transcriptional regulator
MRKVQAYVFLDTVNPGPMRIVAEVRKIPGVVRADALFGVPDIMALVEGDDLSAMDEVINRIVELNGVVDSESKVIRWV